MKKVFVTAPADPKFDSIRHLIKNILKTIGAEYVRLDYAESGTLQGVRNLSNIIDQCDLVIADLTGMNPFVLMEVGCALGLGKKILTLTHDVNIARIIPNELVYSRKEISQTLIYRLDEAIRDSIGQSCEENVLSANNPSNDLPPKQSIFISYSHKDIDIIERLKIHLKPLERKGLVDLWVDSKIKPGDNWKSEIASALNRANLAILIISADFLASDFIITEELPVLLYKAEQEGTRILPIIAKPSSFSRNLSLSRFQSINDPQNPLIKMNESERETLFAKIAEIMESEISPYKF